MGVKRTGTTTAAQTAGKAKKNKVSQFFNRLNLPSTSTSPQTGYMDSQPHGGQPVADSQDSLDNVPLTSSCMTLAATTAADDQPLAEHDRVLPKAIEEVVEADSDKESHIVLKDFDMIAGIPETQIDMPETKAEDMHTGEPIEKPENKPADIDKPADEPAEDMADGFTTPPRAALKSLTDAIDSESDPEQISKFYQDMNGTQQRLGKDLADSLEANFNTLAGKFSDVGPDLDPDSWKSALDGKTAKKVAGLDSAVNNNAWDCTATYAQAFRREHGKDPMFTTLGRADATRFKLNWAKTQLRTINTEHTKQESFSRVDSTKGHYKNFSQLVVSQGGI